MKRKLLFISSLLAISIIAVLVLKSNSDEDKTVEDLRKQHLSFLENSPFKETQNLSRKERKAMGLPPNAYNEQLWELTMDPAIGRPTSEVAIELQRELITERAIARGVGGESINPWVNRGPSNQGGRTRGIMFDPNDIGNANPDDDFTRVFAGGVSGGLWVNEDITDADVSWVLVPTIQQNISVTAIISDPNNSNIFYIASGESYTQGSAVGRGVWRSLDAGITWEIVLGGGVTSVTNGGQNVNGIFYVNDIVARDNGGVTEIYAAVASGFYASAGNPNNFQGVEERGLYKSSDNGGNWNRFPIQFNDGTFKNPNDIEIDINNNIWLATTSDIFGNDGGEIYSSTDGLTFSLINSLGTNADRTEIEPSPTDPNKFWIVTEVAGSANILITTDAFATITAVNEPNDVDTSIPANDYTRNQAFYDLPVEVDQNNILYVGGIDLFRSPNDGTTWAQISKWSNNNALGGLNVPLVHADQHAIVFRPGTNDTEALIGNDGGVYYTANIASAANSPNAIQSRNKDFVTTQFYYGAINPLDAADGDDFAGGTQDNGTQFIIDGVAGLNEFFDPVGGDGGFTEIDEGYAITSYPGNNHIFFSFPSLTNGALISSGNGGSFINEATLDKGLDILYTNATAGGTVRIERIKDFLPGGAATNSVFLTSAQFNASPSALKVSPYVNGSSTLYVGLRSGRLLVGGFANITNPTFTNIAGPGFTGSISDIEFGQSNQEIFVTMHNYGVTNVWFTNNGGNSWTNIEGNLPNIPVKCILQNPLIPQELIIGTELGVWATPDYTVASPVWVQAYNGMSDVAVLDLDLRAVDNTILATTHGRGLFTSQFTSQPLSVLESEFNANVITLFPTISNGQITIKSQRDLGTAVIKVYKINGQEVYNAKSYISTSNTNLGLNLNAGIYFVNISVNNYSETKKIIIK